MAEWVKFKQYAGFEILNDASKIRTPDGIEHSLESGKLFYFTNPNSGIKNFATPETLLSRAMTGKMRHTTGRKTLATLAVKQVRAKEVVQKEPKIKKEKAKKVPTVKKVRVSKLLASKDALLSEHARGELKVLAAKRAAMDSNMNGIELFDGKNISFRVLLSKDDVHILHIICQNWRDGYWFYNMNTGAYEKFVKDVHQPLPGNDNIKWPEL